MSFKEGNKFSKLSKRGEGKITKEVKSKLMLLLEISSILVLFSFFVINA